MTANYIELHELTIEDFKSHAEAHSIEADGYEIRNAMDFFNEEATEDMTEEEIEDLIQWSFDQVKNMFKR